MSTPAELAPPSSAGENVESLRLKIVTRRFWPYSGTTELQVADLAQALSIAGHEVEIVTIRWDKTWPTFFRFRGIDVWRLNRPTTGPWGSFRYLRSLGRHITADMPDGLIVFGMGAELTTIQKVFGAKIPYLVSLDEFDLGIRPDAAFLNQRQVNALATAESIICESDWTADRMKEVRGIADEKIVVAGEGIFLEHLSHVSRDLVQRNMARRALADAHPMLVVPDGQPLLVCLSPMVGDPGMIDLVQAWKRLVKTMVGAKLWIVGEGPRSRDVWRTIVEKQLTESIIMPGEFDQLEDIITASDMVIHPLQSKIRCAQLTRALCAGACAMVTSSRAACIPLTHEHDALVIPKRDPESMATSIANALANTERLDEIGKNAKALSVKYRIEDRIPKLVQPIVAAIGSRQ
ncbi:MAG: glycosyltransferase family 4 protein [Planctomycetota bacterium]